MTTFELPATLSQIANLSKKLNKTGASVVDTGSNSWRIAAHGVKAMAEFDPGTGKLKISVSSKPIYVSMDRIQEGIQEALVEPA